MKQMTCEQLGGCCGMIFTAATFDDIAEMSQQHGMKMFQLQDEPHLKAMQKIQQMVQSPDGFQRWMAEKKEQFDALPDVE
jgi:hypothetical protein|tara:strand:+ start:192 stop:431 length:240 start_codon:yes stop_codon:yes gene_type:complete